MHEIKTIHGLLAIGKNPQEHIPGAYIQFLRLNGTRLVDEVIDEAMICGSVVNMMTRVDDKLIEYNRRAFDITSGPTHKITVTYCGSQYPITAKNGSRTGFDDEQFYMPPNLPPEQIKNACVQIYHCEKCFTNGV